MICFRISQLFKRFTDPTLTRLHQTSVDNLLSISGLFGMLGNILYLLIFLHLKLEPLIISTVLGTLFYIGLLILKRRSQNPNMITYLVAAALTIQQIISAWYIGPDSKFQVLILIVPLVLVIGIKNKSVLKGLLSMIPIAIFLLIENELIPGFNPKFEISSSTTSYIDTINTSIAVSAFFVVFFLHYYRLDKTNILLNQKYEEAVKLSEAKSRLISNVSHEMKTPLNAILGLTQVLEMKHCDDESIKYSNDVRVNAEKLILKIQQVLDYTAYAYNVVSLNETEVSASELRTQWISLFKSYHIIESVKYDIITNISDENRMVFDQYLLTKVVKNVLDNSIKFTSKGTIKIDFRIETTSSDYLIIQIVDTGIGMNSETLSVIFEPLETNEDYTKNKTGLGLGIAVSKKIVEALRGSFSVESSQSLGTSVSIRIPIKIIKTEVLQRKIDKKYHILIVDDNKINALVASKFIEKMGFYTSICDNALSAYIEAQKLTFDLILMDHMMPELDGSTAAKYIRQNISGYKNIPIIAYTANLQMNEYLALGFDDILMKPIRYADIEQLLGKHLR